MEVIEGLDGTLRVLRDRYIIPSQEALPKQGTLRRAIPRTSVFDRALNEAAARHRTVRRTTLEMESTRT